jgi:hypothetical protein
MAWEDRNTQRGQEKQAGYMREIETFMETHGYQPSYTPHVLHDRAEKEILQLEEHYIIK